MSEEIIHSDADLIELSKKDPEMFGLLMERYQGSLFMPNLERNEMEKCIYQ